MEFIGEPHKQSHSKIRELILGSQDGLVNVLGVILGISAATAEPKIILAAGLAAAFAESISMAAVAYTSEKAARDFYQSELNREKNEIGEVPEKEKKEVRDIYYEKGFRGTFLNRIVQQITSDKERWVDIMMKEELRLFPDEYESPMKSAGLVGSSAFIGSIIPLIAFFFLAVSPAIPVSLLLSIAALFTIGALKAKLTVGSWLKSGTELAAIGMGAALVGYAIGASVGVAV